jgi:hypothetical protein
MEKPGTGRAKISDNGSALQIIIPSKKNIGLIVLFTLWLGGWAIGEINVIKSDLGFTAFTPLWLAAWTVDGVYMMSVIVRAILGKEMITISAETIKIEKTPSLFIRLKKYNLADATNLRILTNTNIRYAMAYLVPPDSLGFDYGMKTVRFGSGLDEAEAAYIINMMKNRGFNE